MFVIGLYLRFGVKMISVKRDIIVQKSPLSNWFTVKITIFGHLFEWLCLFIYSYLTSIRHRMVMTDRSHFLLPSSQLSR